MERDKFGKFVKGHSVSKKTILALRKANRNRPSWNKGKHLSEKTKNKLRQIALNMPQKQRDKISNTLKKYIKIHSHWNKNIRLSQTHKDKISKAMKGKIRYRKKVIFKSKGLLYYQLYKPEYRHSSKNGYIFEHRYIMEQYLKRPLTRREVIHHINGNTLDNRIENLMLYSSQFKHMLYHKKINQGILLNSIPRQTFNPTQISR